MLRTFVCAVLALTLVTGVSFAGGKGASKKGKPIYGTITKVDAKEGRFTVAIKSKKSEAINREFKLSGDSTIVAGSGTEKKELTGTEGLKLEGFKQGAAVSVVTAKKDASRVLEVRLGETKKKKKQKAA
jgi:hypothetical protein